MGNRIKSIMVKHMLFAALVLAAMSGAVYSQGVPQTSGEKPVHPGTALLDSMGIFAGYPAPAANTQSANAQSADVVAARTNETATKQ